MDDHILAMYCLCTDVLTALHHAEDCQHKLTDVEVMTMALVAMVCFGGNFEHARALLGTRQYMPTMPSRIRFNRRVHLIQDLFVTLFSCLGEPWKEINIESIYVIDSFPMAMCDDVHALRAFQFDVPAGSSIYADKAYNDFGMEDLMKESGSIELSPIRKKNSARMIPPYPAFVQHYHRKRIETAASLIERVCPKRFMRSLPAALT
jgi:hypothetical protein